MAVVPINGVDVSSNQATFNFALAVQQGYRTAYIKVGGQNVPGNVPYQSGVYSARVDQARAAGMIVGHYWVPGLHDPVGSAKFFLQHLHNVQPGDYFVLDNETLDAGNAYSDAESAAWIATVQHGVGGSPRRVKHYESESPLAHGSWPALLASGCGFIVAWYGHPPLAFTSIGSIPADRIDGHQYADDGSIGGAPRVDLDAFKDNAFDYSAQPVLEDDEMKLIWTTDGTGWLFVPGKGFYALSSLDLYYLFFRLINSRQNLAPGAAGKTPWVPQAVEGAPDTFTLGQLQMMNAVLQQEPYKGVPAA